MFFFLLCFCSIVSCMFSIGGMRRQHTRSLARCMNIGGPSHLNIDGPWIPNIGGPRRLNFDGAGTGHLNNDGARTGHLNAGGPTHINTDGAGA